MKFRMIASSLAVILLATSFASAASPDEKRTKTRKMADKTLQELYKLQPAAQGAIQKSAGYAVFDNMGTNLLLLSTARGSGIAVATSSKQETFMKMVSAGAGLGVGVKDYRLIFVFENDKAYNNFPNSGWSGSAQATRRPRQAIRAELTRERKRLPRASGSIKLPRMVSPCS